MKNDVHYVVGKNGKTHNHNVCSFQFFYSSDIWFYLMAWIRSLSLELSWFDLARWEGQSVYVEEWKTCNINWLCGKFSRRHYFQF